MSNIHNNLTNRKPCIIWLTGLPCSGKSTVALRLKEELLSMQCQATILDGDVMRRGLSRDLGYSSEDRSENIRRAGEVAKLLVETGFTVITAFISPFIKDRDRVRSLLPEGQFIEVFVKAGLDICEQRDVKGLYKKARSGDIADYTGITHPYEEPKNPEIILNTDKEDIKESVEKIVAYLSGLQVNEMTRSRA